MRTTCRPRRPASDDDKKGPSEQASYSSYRELLHLGNRAEKLERVADALEVRRQSHLKGRKVAVRDGGKKDGRVKGHVFFPKRQK